MLVKDEGPKFGSAPATKPEGAKWAEPLEIRDLLTYRADGEGYLEPGFEKIFLVPATGGAPRQLTFGPYHDGGPLSWSRSEEHTSELQSLMRISYAVFCLKKKIQTTILQLQKKR